MNNNNNNNNNKVLSKRVNYDLVLSFLASFWKDIIQLLGFLVQLHVFFLVNKRLLFMVLFRYVFRTRYLE